MNELQVFTNPEFGQVRTVTIEEEPWFVGKDVAVALGYESPRAAVSKKVDPEDKGVSEMETPSGKQQMTIINESGLYALIFGSKLESAKRFKHWVTHEVLPAINLSFDLYYQREWSWDDVSAYVTEAINGYFLELAQSWADQNEALVVRISQVESRLLGITGILDIANTKINGEAANCTLTLDHIPVLGTIEPGTIVISG